MIEDISESTYNEIFQKLTGIFRINTSNILMSLIYKKHTNIDKIADDIKTNRCDILSNVKLLERLGIVEINYNKFEIRLSDMIGDILKWINALPDIPKSDEEAIRLLELRSKPIESKRRNKIPVNDV